MFGRGLGRFWLVGLAVMFALLAAGASIAYLINQPLTYVVAVGPPGGEDVRLLTAIASQWRRERAPFRLRITVKSDPAEAANAIDQKTADLAVVRGDSFVPIDGRAVVILRKHAVAIIASPGLKLESISELAGRRIGVVGRAGVNFDVLDTVLSQYGLGPRAVRAMPIDPGEIYNAVRERRVDILFVAAPMTSRPMADAVAAMSTDTSGPTFVPIGDSEAIAQRLSVYEATEIVSGAFGGSPPRPAEKVQSIGFSYYLMARKGLDESAVGDMTRLLLNMRQSLAGDFPGIARIEAPDTDKDAAVPAHPGAAAYIDGEQKTFFDRYSDLMYWGVMLVSFVGSGMAALASRLNNRQAAMRAAQLAGLLQIVRSARNAPTADALERLHAEADAILAQAIGEAEKNQLTETSLMAFTLALEQAQLAIAERRAALADSRETASSSSLP